MAQADIDWAVERCVPRTLVDELAGVLDKKNGFFAFENALLVMPSRTEGTVVGLAQWNAPEGWTRAYDRLPKPTVFFAQDVFAGQYGISELGVIGLEPETGALTLYGATLEDWSETMLEDYDLASTVLCNPAIACCRGNPSYSAATTSP